MSAEDVDISPNKDGGILKKIVKEGSGSARPVSGNTVRVHYVGTLTNGDKFDSSRDRGEPFEFPLGQGQVIKGWDIGVATMTKGELAVFTIRGDYAYGKAGSPPKIPPDATLVFEVELIEWVAEDISPERDGSIRRAIIVEGDKYNNPNEASAVQVHVVGKFEDRVFLDSELTFALGEGSEHKLPEGVDRALRRFGKGEKSIVYLKGSRYTYGNDAPKEFNLPINAPLEFTVFLKEFEKSLATWEMSPAEKIKASKEAKDRGTMFLQQGKLKLALNKYKRIEEILEYEKSGDPEEKKERETLLIAAFLNISLVYSKMDEQANCIKYCDKALEMQPSNVKALYRKGGALLTQNDCDEAAKIFQKCLEIEPDNKAATQQLAICKLRIRELEERDKKRFKGMFEKMAREEPSTATAN